MPDTEKVEVWKDIPNWEGFYQVSNKGRVRSVTRYLDVFWRGTWRVKRYKGRIIKGSLVGGYNSFTLSSPSKTEYYYAHTLVALVFIGPRPEGLEIRHLDGIRTNSGAKNLLYGTSKENAEDMVRHGRAGQTKGERIHCAKLTCTKVKKIRKLSATFSQRELGAMFGVSHTTIGCVQRKELWRHVKWFLHVCNTPCIDTT